MRFARTTTLLVLMLIAFVSQAAQPDEQVSCASAVAGCQKIGGACVMLRFTQNNSCDAHCQRDLKKKSERPGFQSCTKLSAQRQIRADVSITEKISVELLKAHNAWPC